ncbi:helix-turn-helix domain-containing protein [Streptomyces rhizosphaericus]|uniref:helix-turn-helix domain-containing protein n=1 Tax=Streptomyces rhizosphaericus TaxID=114699 RepID=UPI0020306A81|nr:helix-turn-helix transcriptional regulator [Streptomyces rhizosphaericus]
MPTTGTPARTFSSDALRQIRRERGVTQRKLAAAIGRDFTSISMYENGRSTPWSTCWRPSPISSAPAWTTSSGRWPSWASARHMTVRPRPSTPCRPRLKPP